MDVTCTLRSVEHIACRLTSHVQTKIAFSRHVSMDMHLRDDCEGPLWLAALHCTPALEYLTLSREGASGLIVNLFGVEPYPLCDVLRSPRLRRVYSYEPQICFCDPTSIEFLERNVPRFRELLAFEPPTRQELWVLLFVFCCVV